MLITKCMTTVALLGMLFFVTGCTPEGTKPYSDTDKGEKHKEHEHEEHAHGPHGGHVIELGEEEYHAEVVFDHKKTRDITVYIFGPDHDMKTTSPIEAKEVKLNLMVEKKPLILTLTANPQEGDKEGKSSRFTLAGKEVPESIHDEEEIVGKLSLTAGGKPYNGEIAHDHDHGDHEGHDDDKDHDHDKEKKDK